MTTWVQKQTWQIKLSHSFSHNDWHHDIDCGSKRLSGYLETKPKPNWSHLQWPTRLVTLCKADCHSERTKPHVGTSACFLYAHWSRCKIKHKKGKPKACSSPVTLQGNSNYTENTLSLPPTFSTPHRRNKPRGRTHFPVPLFVSTFSISVLTFQFRNASAS